MNSNYKPMKSRLRASFAAGQTEEPRLEGVDRENNKLNGVQITLEGEALGHDVWLDRQFCQDVVDAGNATGDAGVKVRFGHPSMCSDALGTYLGRAKNFRLVDLKRKCGDAACGVLADVELDPNADRTEWILNMSESAPDTFGQSIVFTYADLKVKDAEGAEFMMSAYESEEEWKSHSADGKVFAVLGKLHGSDFTDTPAATDGVFSADDLAAEATEMLEQHPELSKVSGKSVMEFLKRSGREDILEAFENARVSGLQKAQAAEKADWETKMTALAQERDELAAKLAEAEKKAVSLLADAEKELAAALAAKEEISLDLKAKEEDLTAAKTALDAELAAHETTKKDLEDARASLKVESERYAEQVAPALQMCVTKSDEEIMHDRNAKPEERLAAASAVAKARRKSK